MQNQLTRRYWKLIVVVNLWSHFLQEIYQLTKLKVIICHRSCILIKYCQVIEWLYTGFGLVIGFIELLKNVTANNYDSLTELHTPKITVPTAHIKSSQFARFLRVGAWWRIPTMSSASVVTLLPADDCLTTNSLFQLSTQCQSQSYVTTDGQSASLSWCQAPIWGPRPDFYYCQTVAGLLMWGALSYQRTGLSCTTAAGPRQRSHTRVRVPRDSWSYFTVWGFSTNRSAYNISTRIAQKKPFLCCFHLLPCKHACLRSPYSVTTVVYLLILRSLPSNGSECHNVFILHCLRIESQATALEPSSYIGPIRQQA
jgi:hypothetical protein